MDTHAIVEPRYPAPRNLPELEAAWRAKAEELGVKRLDARVQGVLDARLAEHKSHSIQTYAHVMRTALAAPVLARNSDERLLTFVGSSLHDVGKIQHPAHYFEGGEPFGPTDYARLQAHPVQGAELLRTDLPHRPDVMAVVGMHHAIESPGTKRKPYGWTLQRARDEIGAEALGRVLPATTNLALADSLDAMLTRTGNTRFLAERRRAFRRLLSEYPDQHEAIRTLLQHPILEFLYGKPIAQAVLASLLDAEKR